MYGPNEYASATRSPAPIARRGEHVPELAAPPGPVLGGVEHLQRRAGRAAGVVQVGVPIERKLRFVPNGGMRGLVGEQLLLARTRQGGQVVPVARARAAEPPSLERVAREDLRERAESRSSRSSIFRSAKNTVSPWPWRWKSIA